MQQITLGHSTKSKETCAHSMVRRVAAMLDLDTESFPDGAVLPQGWHFFMLAGETRRSALRSDGFPGLGIPIPDLGLPRLLLGGRTVVYKGDIIIGSVLEKTSFVKSVSEKTTPSGPMAIVTLQHELRPVLHPDPAIIETQTYILLGNTSPQAKSTNKSVQPLTAKHQKCFVPDGTLLFQYAALGFNSHKIHLDRHYAQTVEGLPDLVVNGGLSTLLFTEWMRMDLGLEWKEIKVKHVSPLYCNQKMKIVADSADANWQFQIFDEVNTLAVEINVETK